MTLNEYQEFTDTTRDLEKTPEIIYTTFGLCGESGEVADKIKKAIRDADCIIAGTRREGIAMELGDVLWYIAQLSRDLGYSLEEIAQMNMLKLNDRLKRGVIGGSGDNR